MSKENVFVIDDPSLIGWVEDGVTSDGDPVWKWDQEGASDSTGAGMIICSETELPPVNERVTGMQWLDSERSNVYVWDDDKWLMFPATGGQGADGAPGEVEEAPDDGKQYVRESKDWSELVIPDGGTGSSVHIGEAPPADPQEGQQWMEVPADGDATMWIYDGDKWLQQPGGKDGADGQNGADGNIADATEQGVIATWDNTSQQWTPNDNIIVYPSGTFTSSGNAEITGQYLLQRESGNLFLSIARYWDGINGSPLNGTKGDILAIGNTGGDGLVFANGDAERMRINADGKVITGDNIVIQDKAGGVGALTELTFVNSDVVTGQSGRAAIQAERVSDPSGGFDGSTLSFITTNGGDTAEFDARMTIDAEGNVGIGTDTPLRKLHISEDSGSAFLQVTTKDDSSSGGVLMGSSSNPTVGQVFYDHDSDSMRLVTSNEERMIIDADGNVLVNTDNKNPTAPSENVEGVSMSSAFGVRSSVSGNTLTLNRVGDFGDIALFRKDGERGGAISVIDGHLAIRGPSASGSEAITIDANGRVDITGSLYVNGTPKIGTVDLIKAFSKLRDAVKDEETVESLKESITNCIGGLIEEWEAMQSPATQEIEQ